jgi:pSer/pThr/pTyr-binding forkhead associated (FHA) protein
MPRLIIFDDRVRGVELPPAPVIIGRSKRSDIPIRDTVLSRRHCALVPEGATHRLVDLRSAHGTYLNGRRVQEVELRFEDVIEMGSTVMVFLDELVCRAAPSFGRLRHPRKAQEILQRLAGMHEPGAASIRVRALPRRVARDARPEGAAEGEPAGWEPPWLAGEGGGSTKALAGLLSEIAVHKAMSALARRRGPWRRLVVAATREALALLRESGPLEAEELRARLRRRLEERWESLVPRAETPGAGPDPAEAADGVA